MKVFQRRTTTRSVLAGTKDGTEELVFSSVGKRSKSVLKGIKTSQMTEPMDSQDLTKMLGMELRRLRRNLRGIENQRTLAL